MSRKPPHALSEPLRRAANFVARAGSSARSRRAEARHRRCGGCEATSSPAAAGLRTNDFSLLSVVGTDGGFRAMVASVAARRPFW